MSAPVLVAADIRFPLERANGVQIVKTAAVNADQTIRACLYNEDTSSYGGTLATQGRCTNGSPEPCTQYALQSQGRFIHIEQSHDLREHERALMNALITRALLGYFAP